MTKQTPANSISVEDYLKAIFRLTGDQRAYATTTALAAELAISAPSVSGMLRKLAANKLIVHSPYNGARLTAEGQRRALRILRRHRLVELFLHKCLGLTWDEIHEEAEVLEHALSDRLEARIDEWLGHPGFDPHGEPIPDASGYIKPRKVLPLSEIAERSQAIVAQVGAQDADMLVYFGERRIYPNRKITVLGRDKFGGSLKVRVAGRIQYVGLAAAQNILVEQP